MAHIRSSSKRKCTEPPVVTRPVRPRPEWWIDAYPPKASTQYGLLCDTWGIVHEFLPCASQLGLERACHRLRNGLVDRPLHARGGQQHAEWDWNDVQRQRAVAGARRMRRLWSVRIVLPDAAEGLGWLHGHYAGDELRRDATWPDALVGLLCARRVSVALKGRPGSELDNTLRMLSNLVRVCGANKCAMQELSVSCPYTIDGAWLEGMPQSIQRLRLDMPLHSWPNEWPAQLADLAIRVCNTDELPPPGSLPGTVRALTLTVAGLDILDVLLLPARTLPDRLERLLVDNAHHHSTRVDLGDLSGLTGLTEAAVSGPIGPTIWPARLTHLVLASCRLGTAAAVAALRLPRRLEALSVRSISVWAVSRLPRRLKTLRVSGRLRLGPPLVAGAAADLVVWPPALCTLELGRSRTDGPLPPNVLPESLRRLSLPHDYSVAIQAGTVPPYLRSLDVGGAPAIACRLLPRTLETLRVGDRFTGPLRGNQMPHTTLRTVLATPRSFGPMQRVVMRSWPSHVRIVVAEVDDDSHGA